MRGLEFPRASTTQPCGYGSLLSQVRQLSEPALLRAPLALARRGGRRRGPRRLLRRLLCCRLGIAAAEDHAARVAVEIVHGAADVGERAAAVGHKSAGALVEVVGKLLDRLDHR